MDIRVEKQPNQVSKSFNSRFSSQIYHQIIHITKFSEELPCLEPLNWAASYWAPSYWAN